MNIKRLELDYWMISRFRDDTVKYDHYTEIAPIIGKPGRYLRDKMEWFECADGRAWQCLKGFMKLEIEWLNAAELNQRQVDALKMVVREGMATKAQRKMLAAWRHAVLDRRSMTLAALRAKKRMQSYKARMAARLASAPAASSV